MNLPEGEEPREAAMTRLFERVAGEQPAEGDIDQLMRMLKLPRPHFPAVLAVIRGGAWRMESDPVRFIKAAVKPGRKTQPVKEVPLVVREGVEVDGHGDNALERTIDFHYSRHEAEGGPHDESDYNEDGEWLSHRDKLLANLPAEFLEEFPWDDDPIVKWTAIGNAVGLDAQECEILAYRAAGISRDRAMKFAGWNRIQAAWRTFDRDKCMERVTAFLLEKQHP